MLFLFMVGLNIFYHCQETPVYSQMVVLMAILILIGVAY